ncbi:hypothetical protein ABIF24_009398 [Bradyrhizobium elkanii]
MVFGASGRGRAKIERPLIDQSIMSRAGPPRLQALRLGPRPLRMGRDRQHQRPAIEPEEAEITLARGEAAEVGRVQLAPLDRGRPQAADSLDPRAVIFALAFLDRPLRLRIDRPPLHIGPDVLDDHATDAQLSQPGDDVPRVGTQLVGGRPPTPRRRMMRAARRRHQQVDIALRNDLLRPGRRDILAIVDRGRVVAPVRLDCDRPMVQAAQIDIEAEAIKCLLGALRRAARTAEQVDDDFPLRHRFLGAGGMAEPDIGKVGGMKLPRGW